MRWKYPPGVSLQEALEDLMASAPLRTIYDIGQVFAHEPKAPKGDWTQVGRSKNGLPLPNAQRAYVVKRMAQTAGVDVRSPQRWIAKYVVEERNPSKSNMAKMRQAADVSQAASKLLDLEVQGTNVDLRATITIVYRNKGLFDTDERQRTIMSVYIEPDGYLRNPKDRLWQNFIDEWRAGNLPEATEAWQTAYFASWNPSIGSAVGAISEVEMLVMATIEVVKAA